MTAPTMPPVQFDAIVLGGGLDQTTPILSLKGGVAKYAQNFECGVSGGYTRVSGYERYDGRTSPSATTNQRIYLSVASYTNPVAVGDTLSVTAGATGTVAYVNGLVIGVTAVTGTYVVGDTVKVGASVIGVLNSVTAGPSSVYEEAVMKNAVADIYRAPIAVVPGSGSVLGVMFFGSTVYAFRNNAGGTACDIYKSSGSGWVNVPLYKTVSFTAGGTATPADGATLTQGGVTALVKRVVKTGGTWTGTAVGQFIITNVAGGNFGAGAATLTGGAAVTLSGIQTQLALAPSGKFEFIEANFTGSTATKRMYGCDGKNYAFEFDGDILVPIMGATATYPTHIVAHRNFLWLGVGSSALHSAPSLPYDYTALAGAAEIAVGDTITGMITMPGGTTSATLGIFSRSNTYILYGNGDSTFNLVAYNTGSGAVEFTVQNMAQTLVYDDRGAISIQTALQYGNFTQSTMTASIVPYIKSHLNLATCASLNREKSQYRVFFSNGDALYCTIVNGKVLGVMPVVMPNPVMCVYEGKLTTGESVSFFGSTSGMVYQLDKGSSFDGSNIDAYVTLNYSTARSPRIIKRYRKLSLELSSYESSNYVPFSVGFSLGYDSEMYEQQDIVNYTSNLSGSSRWDQFTWDNFFWDTAGVAPVTCELAGSAENIALTVSCISDYTFPFSINSAIIHFTPRRTLR